MKKLKGFWSIKKKNKQKIKYKYLDDHIIIPYLPIEDKETTKQLKKLKEGLLSTLEKANFTMEPQVFKFDKSEFCIFPNGDKSIINNFSIYNW